MSGIEVSQLQREERFKDIANRIADSVVLDLVNAPALTPAVHYAAVRKAVAKFGADLPEGMIAQIVTAQVSPRKG